MMLNGIKFVWFFHHYFFAKDLSFFSCQQKDGYCDGLTFFFSRKVWFMMAPNLPSDSINALILKDFLVLPRFLIVCTNKHKCNILKQVKATHELQEINISNANDLVFLCFVGVLRMRLSTLLIDSGGGYW